MEEVLNANRIKIEEIDQILLKIDRKLDRMHDETIKIDAKINILKEECNKLLEEQLKNTKVCSFRPKRLRGTQYIF